jgi:hypothetical protein
MPVKYVDEQTGEFIRSSLEKTGAPSAYGIKTIEELVKTSQGSDDVLQNNIFFKPARM